MTDARKELKFQDHIIDSYKLAGGHARKWATDLQVGMPDLICSLPGVGVHLAEVKHRPEWGLFGCYRNPLTKKQILEATNYKNAGGLVFGYLVVRETDAIGSYLVAFDPTAIAVDTTNCPKVPYVPGGKYDMMQLIAGGLNGRTI
jgi:hypothetical protein